MIFGRQADKNELPKTTPDKRNVIEADNDDKTKDIAKEIMDKAIAGV